MSDAARVASGWVLAMLAASGVEAASPVIEPTPSGATAVSVAVPPVPGVGEEAVDGYWYAAPFDGGELARRGAIVLLHGCGGAWRGQSPMPSGGERLDGRLADVVDLARRAGWHALVVDSFGPRGERELCTQRIGTRRITQRQRRGDALAALAWLAARPDVDAGRLGLVGWSNGGSTVLAAIDATHAAVTAAPARPAFAVAHYPGCSADLARAWRPVVPLTMFLGEDDDWTPAAPCVELARQASRPGGPTVQAVLYPGAVHGFDGSTRRHRRTDVPNGRVPGAGVWVGRDEAAAADVRNRLEALLRTASTAAPGGR